MLSLTSFLHNPLSPIIVVLPVNISVNSLQFTMLTYFRVIEFIVHWTINAIAGWLSMKYIFFMFHNKHEVFFHKLFNSICIDFTWFLIFPARIFNYMFQDFFSSNNFSRYQWMALIKYRFHVFVAVFRVCFGAPNEK